MTRAGFVVLAMWLIAVTARAEQRYAVLIGANRGEPNEPVLRYAEADARRVGEVLSTLGGFPQENVTLLLDTDAERVRSALVKLRERMKAERRAGERVLLFVFYSGHANAAEVHLGGTLFPWDELVSTTRDAPADVRLLVVDACRSGRTTRVKGTRVRASPIVPKAAMGPEGFAVISSATQQEDAQESDELRASFFTHHFVSALRGAGDANGDGTVDLNEAYGYAAERTAASTAATLAGVQHPTYRFELRGRDDVVLTRPGYDRNASALVLAGRGTYVLHRDAADGPIELEANVSRAGTRLWLRAGTYFVRWRTTSQMYEGRVQVPRRTTVALDTERLRSVQYAQLVRKGVNESSAWNTSLWGGYSTATLPGYAGAWSASAMLSVDLESVTLDVVARGALTSHDKPDIEARLYEVGGSLGARKVFDIGLLSLSGGIRAGASYQLQRFRTSRIAPDRHRVVPELSVVLRAEIVTAFGLFVGVEGALRVSYVTNDDAISTPRSQPMVAGMGQLGLGKYW